MTSLDPTRFLEMAFAEGGDPVAAGLLTGERTGDGPGVTRVAVRVELAVEKDGPLEISLTVPDKTLTHGEQALVTTLYELLRPASGVRLGEIRHLITAPSGPTPPLGGKS